MNQSFLISHHLIKSHHLETTPPPVGPTPTACHPHVFPDLRPVVGNKFMHGHGHGHESWLSWLSLSLSWLVPGVSTGHMSCPKARDDEMPTKRHNIQLLWHGLWRNCGAIATRWNWNFNCLLSAQTERWTLRDSCNHLHSLDRLQCDSRRAKQRTHRTAYTASFPHQCSKKTYDTRPTGPPKGLS